MTTLTQQQLNKLLDDHELWLATRGRQGEQLYLHGKVIEGGDFRRNLSEAVLGSNRFRFCDFTGANFSHAHCVNSVFEESRLDFAILSGRFDYCKFPGTSIMSQTIGRMSAYHADFTSCRNFPFLSDAEQRLLDVAIIATRPGNLVMDAWHGCNSTHCIAGWAVHLAGPFGDHLVNLHGHDIAGLMLLGAEAHNYFFSSEEQALAFLNKVIERNNQTTEKATLVAGLS